MTSQEAISAVLLLPDGEVWHADDTGYSLGSIFASQDDLDLSNSRPLIAKINVSELGAPTVEYHQQEGWRVHVLAGQGQEPIQGRTNVILLRVVSETPAG